MSADLIQLLAAKQNVTIPKLHARKVTHHLYAVWKGDDIGTAHCVEACCHISAKSEYTAMYVVIDDDEVELNKMYALKDTRATPESSQTA